MKKIKAYYFIYRAIESSKNIAQIEACERMINNVHGLLAASYLANLALFKKVQLLTTYPAYE